MSDDTALHPLWGGILDRVEIDLLHQRAVLDFHVIDSSESPVVQRHLVEVSGVSEFRWFSSIPGPWNYAEVTEFHFRSAPAGGVIVDVMLWSEDAGVIITAESALFDGTPMIPEEK